MRIKLFCFLSILPIISLRAQTITCSPENRNAVDAKIEEIKGIHHDETGDLLVAIGRTFIGTPYVAQTLETGSDESLVIDLEGLDCTTFVENVLALGIIGKNPNPNFDEFVKKLEKIRYRDGKLKGYASRLHYFTEWVRDNEKKGLVKDITAELGGTEISKELNFMTDHRSLYPALKEENMYQEMIAVEESVKNQSLCVLSVEMLKENEAMIVSGDIIALATSIEGLDVTHTGFAIRMPDNRIHLLHASSKGAVEISELPLVDYLKKIKKNTGVIMARPVF
ncbi:N-acetylmuramoyl-L-alanine amidase-like domain-containing protein [Muriicola sp. E247]|uniref:N-acetylmuramoyl-L-alanine amidase-like domain-containing protein n=1 Tax=Muriicola sp. E247 TaxID=3242730 RepID=UPI003524FA71